MLLNNRELVELKGGALSASYINAITRGATFLLDLGRAIGSAIRRGFTKNYC